MKIRGNMKWFILLGMLVASLVHAATPASTTYLDRKMAVIQAEIDEIYLNVFGN